MSGLIPSVTPRNDAFAGGTLARAGQPTAAGGSFTSAGASGFTAPGVPAILSARNNSGSNVRIPYARVVPLHAKDALPVKDLALVGTGQKTAFEYDGLESGELAWVHGKSFPIGGIMYPQTVDFSALATQMPHSAPGRAGAVVGGAPVGPDGAPLVPHIQPNGFGPDRMQRLAYTKWVESHFITRVGRQTIDLKAFNPFDGASRAIDSELDYWAMHGAGGGVNGNIGGDLFAMPDLAYAFQTPTSATMPQLQIDERAPMPQGLFVMERGPFLRSIGTNHRPIEIEAHIAGDIPTPFINKQTVGRHLGSDLAQKGLEVLLKRSGVFNWVPDGVCLSKYETGPNGQADAEHDARASQLFNVAVQGPAITKTWTHDPKLQCMPMDKVFMLVVGDLSYTVDADQNRVQQAAEMTQAIRDRVRDRGNQSRKTYMTELDALMIADGMSRLGVDPGPGGGGAPTPVANRRLGGAAAVAQGATGAAPATEASFTAWVGTGGAYPAAAGWDGSTAPAGGERDGIRGYEQTVQEDGADSARARAMYTRAVALWEGYRNAFGLGAGALRTPERLLDTFDINAAALRSGRIGVKQAKISNLRLMRATSSYLAQYSHFSGNIESPHKDRRESRLGLPLDFTPSPRAGAGAGAGPVRPGVGGLGQVYGGSGSGSYVLGGWCIGTVLDSAASRSAMNNTVRTAPASMALNISVNVEWWSADKLYQHYQDKERYVKNDAKIAAGVTAAGGNPGNYPEDAASLAIARSPALQGTVSMRTEVRMEPSRKYSVDYDPEEYPDDLLGAGPPNRNTPDTGALWRRGWTAVQP